MTPVAALSQALADHLPTDARRIGVAVSGGGDSVALLVLLADWAADVGATIMAASVDHGLRQGSAEDAALAGQVAAGHRIPHETLPVRVGPRGNLQAGARAARYAALSAWADRHGLHAVCLAHTIEDQGETVLLRLARGSGIDGLSAMAPAQRDAAGRLWLRPLLAARRADLRGVLRDRGVAWAEDPTNADPAFDRVKARAVLVDPPLPGLTPERLAETATRMAAGARALNRTAAEAADRIVRVDHGAIAFDMAGFAGLADDTRWRLLASALCMVSGATYRPRLAPLRAAEAAAREGRRATLHGCLVKPFQEAIWVIREPAAIAGVTGPAPGPWDSRWRIHGPDNTGFSVTALGPAVGADRPANLPLEALETGPAIRDRTGVLIATPALMTDGPKPPEWWAEPAWGPADFRDRLIFD